MLVCFWIFLGNSAYHRTKLMAISHRVSVGMHKQMSAIGDYFSLSHQNQLLLTENVRLHKQLSAYKEDTLLQKIDYELEYHIVKVVRNTYTGRNNFITIASGLNQGILPNMALFNGDGIVGYVKYCSSNFSVAVSVLNVRDFRTSGKLLGDEGQGSIWWDGGSYREVVMDEIPAHTKLQIGDTVTTTEFSNIFPEGLCIGVVRGYEVVENLLMRARLELLADMSSLTYLYAVMLEGQGERRFLERLIEE